MVLIVKLFVLIALVRGLTVCERPFVMAPVYTSVSAGFCLFSSAVERPVALFIAWAIILSVSYLYFSLLDRLSDKIGLWWVVFVLGLPLVLF